MCVAIINGIIISVSAGSQWPKDGMWLANEYYYNDIDDQTSGGLLYLWRWYSWLMPM